MQLLGVSLLVILNLAVAFGKVAPVLEICSASDPDLGGCIAKVVDKIRTNIASGDFGDGKIAPKLDPYFLKSLDIDHGPSFKANLRNLTIDGISKFEIRKIRDDLKEKRFNISIKLPHMFVQGKYNLNMNILLLRLAGKGDFNLTLENTLGSIKLQYYLDQKDGKDYFKFHPVELKLKFDKAEFYLQNLFGGDPALEKIGNQAINANPQLLLNEVKPSMEEQLAQSLSEISNTVVADAEEKELLPA